MTEFEKRVLRETLKIPLGEVRTYKWLAKKCGWPKAWRAVANALNKNPYTLFIPCHRVVACGDKLGGYALGTKLKQELLAWEKKIKASLRGNFLKIFVVLPCFACINMVYI